MVDPVLEKEIQTIERLCLNSSKHPIVSTVLDTSMEPFFSKGDIIGAEGITPFVDFEKPTSKSLSMKIPFLVEIESGNFQPRFLGSNVDGLIKFAYSNNGHHITELKYNGLGKIIWIRKFS